MERDLRTAMLYLLAFLPAALTAVVANYASLAAANAVLPRFSPLWIGVLLNFIPSAVAGGAVYGALARWRRPTPSVTTAGSRHVVRTAPLYALAITLAVVLWDGFHNPRSGFGLVAQLVVWPLAAVVGGIIADAVVLGRRRRRALRRPPPNGALQPTGAGGSRWVKRLDSPCIRRHPIAGGLRRPQLSWGVMRAKPDQQCWCGRCDRVERLALVRGDAIAPRQA